MNLEFSAKVFLASFVLLTIYFFVAVQPISEAMANNFLIMYTIFIVLFAGLSLYAVTGKTPWEYPKMFVILIISLLIFDVVNYPYLVTTNGVPPNLPPEATISADVFVYKLIPFDVPDWTKYVLVYPFAIALGVFIISLLSKNKKEFNSYVKQGAT